MSLWSDEISTQDLEVHSRVWNIQRREKRNVFLPSPTSKHRYVCEWYLGQVTVQSPQFCFLAVWWSMRFSLVYLLKISPRTKFVAAPVSILVQVPCNKGQTLPRGICPLQRHRGNVLVLYISCSVLQKQKDESWWSMEQRSKYTRKEYSVNTHQDRETRWFFSLVLSLMFLFVFFFNEMQGSGLRYIPWLNWKQS